MLGFVLMLIKMNLNHKTNLILTANEVIKQTILDFDPFQISAKQTIEKFYSP